MTDGKLDALRRDPAFTAVSGRELLWLGRVVDLLDVPAGEVLCPPDRPSRWAYYCCTGRLHVLMAGRPVPAAVAPVLFLPDDLMGVALVAATSSRVVALPVAALPALLSLAPGLRSAPRHRPAPSTTEVR